MLKTRWAAWRRATRLYAVERVELRAAAEAELERRREERRSKQEASEAAQRQRRRSLELRERRALMRADLRAIAGLLTMWRHWRGEARRTRVLAAATKAIWVGAAGPAWTRWLLRWRAENASRLGRAYHRRTTRRRARAAHGGGGNGSGPARLAAAAASARRLRALAADLGRWRLDARYRRHEALAALALLQQRRRALLAAVGAAAARRRAAHPSTSAPRAALVRAVGRWAVGALRRADAGAATVAIAACWTLAAHLAAGAGGGAAVGGVGRGRARLLLGRAAAAAGTGRAAARLGMLAGRCRQPRPAARGGSNAAGVLGRMRGAGLRHELVVALVGAGGRLAPPRLAAAVDEWRDVTVELVARRALAAAAASTGRLLAVAAHLGR